MAILPAAAGDLVRDARLRRWLARSDLEFCTDPRGILARVIEATRQPPCRDGAGALRLWGQTGERPTQWVAAADPVYLEAGLNHLRLRRCPPRAVPPDDLRAIFDDLQAVLGGDDTVAFTRVDTCGYLGSRRPMPTSPQSPAVIDGCDPGDYLPAGPDAGGYQTLLSEVQMTLHASPVNQRREALGLPVINSLWIWGGGAAPEVHARSIPPLFADDALLRGYWNSAAGVAAPWPGSLDRCLERGGTGFVAATPDEVASDEAGADALTGYLRDLRGMLRNGGIRALHLLFRDGLTATVLPRHAFRVWRRELPAFDTGERR